MAFGKVNVYHVPHLSESIPAPLTKSMGAS